MGLKEAPRLGLANHQSFKQCFAGCFNPFVARLLEAGPLNKTFKKLSGMTLLSEYSCTYYYRTLCQYCFS